MADQIKTKPKRRYDLSRRQTRARETQREIIEAARRLLWNAAIRAPQSSKWPRRLAWPSKTLYATFGSKRAVLSRLVGVSVVGDDEPASLSSAQDLKLCGARPTSVVG